MLAAYAADALVTWDWAIRTDQTSWHGKCLIYIWDLTWIYYRGWHKVENTLKPSGWPAVLEILEKALNFGFGHGKGPWFFFRPWILEMDSARSWNRSCQCCQCIGSIYIESFFFCVCLFSVILLQEHITYNGIL